MAKINLRFQQASSALLVIAIAVLLNALATRYSYELDLTAAHNNSLNAASVQQLKSMQSPIKVLAFVGTGASMRSDIVHFFNRYQRASKNISLQFIDPIESPQLVQKYHVGNTGDLVLLYANREELLSIDSMDEAHISQALARLSANDNRTLLFVSGHGEHALDQANPSGYMQLAKILQTNGVHARAINLTAISSIPSNASGVVIAGASSEFLPTEITLLCDYVAQGGNIIWLSNPSSIPPPASLQKKWGIYFAGGTIVSSQSKYTLGNPRLLIAHDYPASAVSGQLTENILLPVVTSIQMLPTATFSNKWQRQVFLQTDASAWLEMQDAQASFQFNPKEGDLAGPLVFGLLLTQPLPALKSHATQQRIVLMGDSDWLSNALIAKSGNSKLALNVFRWASNQDAPLNVNATEAMDQSLDLSPFIMRWIGWFFLLILPIVLLIFGILRWNIRHRR